MSGHVVISVAKDRFPQRQLAPREKDDGNAARRKAGRVFLFPTTGKKAALKKGRGGRPAFKPTFYDSDGEGGEGKEVLLP